MKMRGWNTGFFKKIASFTGIASFAFTAFYLAGVLDAASAATVQPMVRVKDIATVEGVRENQLVGMGLVVGLQGTGDKGQMAMQMMSNMTQQFGVTVDPKQVRSKNAAVVTVTCQLSPFLLPGQNADVVVSAIGDAKSLEGGVLIQTPLKGANGQVYAVAQGPLTLGGWSDTGAASSVKKNVITVGRIPNGAIVEQGVEMNYASAGTLNLLLRQSDFTTAQRVASALNQKFGNIAHAVDARRVEVSLPSSYSESPSAFVASIEGLSVRPDSAARIVVNERTGTVVMGCNDKIGNVSVSHGNLTVQFRENPQVSQPGAFSPGNTAVTPQTDISAHEERPQLVELPSTSSVEDLTEAMNAVGASPRDLIAVLQAMDQAGALHGELIIQ
jgi:flagellar P-ring protein precursor FlgI